MLSALLLAWAMGGDPVGIAKWVIIVGGLIAIVLIALRGMGVPMPQWVWQVLGVLLIVVVCILAVNFLGSL